MTERLRGRTAIITGATTGIGRAIAIRYAQEGAHVVASDVTDLPEWDATDPRPVVEVIREAGGNADYLPADVSNASDVTNLFLGAREVLGRIDVVVNNAAVFTAYNILDTSEADWDHLMAINLRGQFLVAKAAIGQMMEQDIVNEARGRLINISSQHGMVGPPDFFAYGVAKGGTVNMTRQLAVDFGPKYIYVNALAPGRILTRHHTEEEALSVDPTISYSLSRTPFHRLGRPLDVTGPAVFLASDDCTYISGHNLVVDGGWMAF